MQGFWQVVDRRWRIFCLLARKKDMSFESWTCGNHWEPWEGLDSTHCWANQWWIDDWICRCLDHFGFLPSPDPPGRAQGPPEVQPTWKSCSGTWFCHIQHPHLMISLLGRVILQGTGCILDFASFRFVGLVTSIASEQQVGKLHVPSWCFFFSISSEKVFACPWFSFMWQFCSQKPRDTLRSDCWPLMPWQISRSNWWSKQRIKAGNHLSHCTATDSTEQTSGFPFLRMLARGGQGVPKNQEQTLSQGLFMTKCPHSLPSPMHFFAVLFPIVFSSIQPPPRGF